MERQTPNRQTADNGQAHRWTVTSFLLNSTTALAVSTPPRKVGAESSSSYTVTGKGTITCSSRAPTRTVHAATISYFSRCSRSRAQRVLTSRLSAAQRKGRLSPAHQADEEPPGVFPGWGQAELPSSSPEGMGKGALRGARWWRALSSFPSPPPPPLGYTGGTVLQARCAVSFPDSC